jgi:hypothetical protein
MKEDNLEELEDKANIAKLIYLAKREEINSLSCMVDALYYLKQCRVRNRLRREWERLNHKIFHATFNYNDEIKEG